jgi:hypothetical protein
MSPCNPSTKRIFFPTLSSDAVAPGHATGPPLRIAKVGIGEWTAGFRKLASGLKGAAGRCTVLTGLDPACQVATEIGAP